MASDEEGVDIIFQGQKQGLSKQKIETVDLLCEGPIQGITSGSYSYSGVLGEVGWRSADFNYYPFPQNNKSLAWLKSVYWNEVPVLNDQGQYNYQNIDAAFTIGKPNGEVIQTLSPYEQASRNIGERLFGGTTNSKTYRILNELCRAAVINIRIAGLSQTDSNTGDILKDALDYNIYYKPVFNKTTEIDWILIATENIIGKVSKNAYIRNTLIQFDNSYRENKDFMGWEIKIERLTPETIHDTFKTNITYVDSITEIQGNIHTFPNSAVVKCLFDAEFFQNVPERAFETEMLRVKIPGNYDTVLRAYSGQGFATSNGGWDGTFATGKHYTNNPAWCYYDLLTNKRYGLGKYIDPSYVDKWNLYNIAQYCDTLVSDGYGSLEPRFTCNLWISSKEEAHKVINDMASIFRGMTYYSNGNVQAVQDSEKDPNILFTNANVEDGDFNYQSTSKKARHSIAIVRYNDPKKFYRPAVEYVENLDSIRKYGINEVELTAIGCASRGQAIRLGRWALLSDNLETEIVNFKAGLEAAFLRPGDIFKTFDSHKKSKRFGGRALEFNDINSTGTNVVLDYTTDFEPNIEYKISFLTPSYSYNEQSITGLDSTDFSGSHRNFLQSFNFSGWQANNSGNNRTIINFSGGMDYDNYVVTGYAPWVIELSDEYKSYSGSRYFTSDSYDYFRVLNIKEEELNKFTVQGLQYNPQKFIEIESGILFGRDIFQGGEDKIPASPFNFQSNAVSISENTKAIDYSFSISDIKNINEYRVYINSGSFPNDNVPDDEFLVHRLPPEKTYERFIPESTGLWNFRVYSLNTIDGFYSSNFASGIVPIYAFDPIRDIQISSLQIVDNDISYTGNSLNKYVTFVSNNDANPTFSWQAGFQEGGGITGDDLKYRATVRSYSNSQSRIPSPRAFFEEWDITGREWEFTLDKNLLSSGGPYKQYQVIIEAHDQWGKTSAGNYLQSYPEENKWHAYPNSYDILNIKNPSQTGFQLTDFIPTFLTGWEDNIGNIRTGAIGSYETISYIGANNDITIEITSGQLDADLVGGFMYVSTGQFPLEAGITNTGWGGLQITKNRFEFNPKNPIIYHPTAAKNLSGRESGYISISLYDEIDDAMIDEGIDVEKSGLLWTSNNSVIFNETSISSFVFGGAETQGKLHNVTFSGEPPANYTTSFVENPSCILIASGNDSLDLVSTIWMCEIRRYDLLGGVST